MPRPILGIRGQTENKSHNALNVNYENRQTTKMNKMSLDRLLRKKRSKEYMEAIHKLDAGGHVHNQQQVNEIIGAIKKEFPEIELSGILLGYVAVCYLGKPYEVHTLDITGEIIEHYKQGHSLPGGLEKARSIAIYGGYSFIEVYVDCCRAIGEDGSVSVISY